MILYYIELINGALDDLKDQKPLGNFLYLRNNNNFDNFYS